MNEKMYEKKTKVKFPQYFLVLTLIFLDGIDPLSDQ